MRTGYESDNLGKKQSFRVPQNKIKHLQFIAGNEAIIQNPIQKDEIVS